MQYDNYENRIKRVARALSVIVRLLPIIIPTICVIVAGVSTLLAVKGNVGDITVPEQLTYGDSIKCEASAFMSSVHYEYTTDPAGEWTEQAPTLPGTYYVRAVGEGSFGTSKHSDEAKFTIVPKAIDVTLSPSMVYGELPVLTGSLEYGDQLVCDKFEYENVLAEKTLVTPVTSAVKVVDVNGNDVSEAYTLNIIPTSVKVVSRKITVTVEDSSNVYDGKSFSFDKYELTSGTVADGDRLIAVFDRSLTDVGSIKNVPTSLKVVTRDGKDATHKYNITQNIGTLSVEHRTVIVKAGDYTNTYDGEDHTCLDFDIDPSTPLAKNHHAYALSATTVTNSGVYENIVDIEIIDAEGNDKTSNHSFFYEAGTITIDKRVVTVSTSNERWTYNASAHTGQVTNVQNIGYMHTWRTSTLTSITNVGTVENAITITIRDKYGRDATSNYIFDEDFGTLEVTKRSVRIKTEDYRSTYNGKEQKLWRWSVTSELGFAGNDSFTITSGTVSTDVIDTKNEIYTYTLVNSSGADVSANYDLGDFQTGRFIISKHYIDIAPELVEVIYDGKSHAPVTIVIVGAQATIPSHHVFTCEMTGSRIDVGTTVTRIVYGTLLVSDEAGRDVTHNYAYSDARTSTVTITPRTVYIETASASKMYDGTPLTKHEYTVSAPTRSTGLVDGHEISLEAAFTGAQTNVGKSDNTVDVSKIVITNDGVPVTGNYEVKVSTGTLEVTKRPITVKSYSAEKKYDGTPLTAGGGMSENTENPLVEGHELTLTITGQQTKIGSVSNNIECDLTLIVSASGEIVTSNYDISYEQGTLTVTPWAIINVTSASDEKAYDGTPLTNGGYTVEYVEGALKAGHNDSDVSVTGSRTEVGVSPNDVELCVRDASNNIVNEYYIIRYDEGTLEVYEPKQVEITVAEINSDKGGVIYLRQSSYGIYNGTTNWKSSPMYSTLLPGGYNCNYLTSFALKNSGATERTAQIKLITENYMLPYYLGISGDYTVPSYDTHYNGIIEYEYTVSHYALTDEALDDIYSLRGNLGTYASYELDYRDHVYMYYTDIPTDTKAYMDTVIKEQGFDINDGSVIYDIASYIRSSATYNLDYNRELDTSGDVAVEFLRTFKEGVCRHYATSATMLYRALGLPARYVTGYMVETEAGAWTEVTTPGHAWVEVYIDGVGWIQVEVTGSSTTMGTGGAREKIELIPKYQSKVYDGKALEAKNEVDITASLKKLLDMGYTYEVTVRGSQTEVGCGKSTITDFELYDSHGNIVTENFDIKYKDGVLEVFEPEKKVINVLLYQLQQQYNGEALAFEEGDWEVLDLEDGLSLELNINISLTDVGCLTLSDIYGNIEEHLSFTVKDRKGNDVTDQYRIVLSASGPDGEEYLPINIERRGIELTAASETKIYDGKELSNSEVTVSMGKLVDGHTLHAIARGSITEVGEVYNVIDPTTVYITDADGTDVTDNYIISGVIGILTVLEPDEE